MELLCKISSCIIMQSITMEKQEQSTRVKYCIEIGLSPGEYN